MDVIQRYLQSDDVPRLIRETTQETKETPNAFDLAALDTDAAIAASMIARIHHTTGTTPRRVYLIERDTGACEEIGDVHPSWVSASSKMRSDLLETIDAASHAFIDGTVTQDVMFELACGSGEHEWMVIVRAPKGCGDQRCLRVFDSPINALRCQVSHGGMVQYDRDDVMATWTRMSPDERRAMLATIVHEDVTAPGIVSMTGEEMMHMLEDALEGTAQFSVRIPSETLLRLIDAVAWLGKFEAHVCFCHIVHSALVARHVSECEAALLQSSYLGKTTKTKTKTKTKTCAETRQRRRLAEERRQILADLWIEPAALVASVERRCRRY